jgi:hypothetical protein
MTCILLLSVCQKRITFGYLGYDYLLTVQRNLLSPSLRQSNLDYQLTWHHVQEDINLHQQHCDNLRSLKFHFRFNMAYGL